MRCSAHHARLRTFAERGKVLSIKLFSRFYAEVLYRHFDADNNGGLSADEAKAALKFLTKPGAPEAAIALAAVASK